MKKLFVLFLVGQLTTGLVFSSLSMANTHLVEVQEEEFSSVIAEIFHGLTGCTGVHLFPDGVVKVTILDLHGAEQQVLSLQSPQTVEVAAPNGKVGWYLLVFEYGGETQVLKAFLNCN